VTNESITATNKAGSVENYHSQNSQTPIRKWHCE